MPQRVDRRPGIRWGAHDNQPDAHVEGPQHFVGRDPAPLLKEREDRRHVPGPRIDGRSRAFRQHTWKVFRDAAAGDVGHALHQPPLEQRPDRGQIGPVGSQQGVPNGGADFRDECVVAKAGSIEQHLPGERVAVGVQAGGRQPYQRVAGDNRSTVDHPGLLDDADDETGDVVLAVGVETRHLRGFAAEQRAAVLAASTRNTGDDLLRDVRRQTPRRDIVEEEHRLGALDEDVVHAVVHEVGADRIVPARHERHLELGADAVGARHQHRLAVSVAVELKQSAERPDIGQHARGERGFRERLDPADGLVARGDVDAGVAVVHQKSSFPISMRVSSRAGEFSGESQ